MARSDYSTYGYIEEGYNSAGCQFFIMSTDNTQLDGLYAPFGKVIEGMDVVDKVANVEVYYRDEEVNEDYEKPKDEDGNEILSDTPKTTSYKKYNSRNLWGRLRRARNNSTIWLKFIILKSILLKGYRKAK